MQDISDIFVAVDAMDAGHFAGYFADDCTLRFANADVLVGRAAIERGIAHFFSTIAALRHRVIDMWQLEYTTIFQVEVTYTRLDGHQCTMPAAVIARCGADGLIRDYNIFVDLEPLRS